MSRDINYNTLKGNMEDIEEIILEEEIIPERIHKIKKKKRFDDGTPIKGNNKKFKNINRENTPKK